MSAGADRRLLTSGRLTTDGAIAAGEPITVHHEGSIAIAYNVADTDDTRDALRKMLELLSEAALGEPVIVVADAAAATVHTIPLDLLAPTIVPLTDDDLDTIVDWGAGDGSVSAESDLFEKLSAFADSRKSGE